MEKEVLKIPYVEHEAAIFQYRTIIKRLIAALVLGNIVNLTMLFFLLFKG